MDEKEKEVVERHVQSLFNRDVATHREFLERILKLAITSLGIVLAAVGGFGAWLLGSNLDTAVKTIATAYINDERVGGAVKEQVLAKINAEKEGFTKQIEKNSEEARSKIPEIVNAQIGIAKDAALKNVGNEISQEVDKQVNARLSAVVEAKIQQIKKLSPSEILEQGLKGRDGKDGRDGRDGNDGRDGKDAATPFLIQKVSWSKLSSFTTKGESICNSRRDAMTSVGCQFAMNEFCRSPAIKYRYGLLVDPGDSDEKQDEKGRQTIATILCVNL